MTTELLPPPRTSAPVDQAQADRLARLANRRPAPAAGAGAPIPPPARTARTGATPPPANRPTKRRHAARGSRAAALAMSVATTGGLAAWFAQAAQTSSTTLSAVGTTGTTAAASGTATPVTTAAAATASGSSSGSGSATAVAQSTATTATATAATTAATTYTGSAVSTRYGTVQVAITTANGTITDVQAVALPTGGKNDQYSNKAAPVLRTEAIAAQSASIDIVSGATYTSKGYIQSLQSAIDQAVTAGAIAS